MAITLFDATFGALAIKQCTAVQFAPGNNILAVRASAGVSPETHHLMYGEPRAQFSSQDLETILAAIDEIGGLTVANGTIRLPWRVRASGGTYVSGSGHVAIGGSSCYGTLIPQTINAQQDQIATIDLEALLRSSDGFTVPVTYSTGVSLSAPGFEGTFRLGPTSIGGTPITGVTGISVNFGIASEMQRTDGGVYPNDVFIPSADPYVDITFRNHALIGTYGPLFSTSSGAVLSLVKNSPGGTIVALTEEEHITITLDAGIRDVQSVNGQGNSTVEPTLRVWSKTLAIATAQALAEA